MESSLARHLVTVLGIVTYVNVLPLLARVPLGSEGFQQYWNAFVNMFPIPSAVSAVAAAPLIVAWSIRKTLRVTFVLSFTITTLLLLYMHHGVGVVNTQGAGHMNYNLDFLVPWFIPGVTAAITSGVMLVAGLSEGISAARRAPPVRREARLVKPGSPTSGAQPSAASSAAFGLGLFAILQVVAGLGSFARPFISKASHDRAQAEKADAQAEIVARISGAWSGTYSTERSGGGTAELELKVGIGGESDIQGTWILKPAVPVDQTDGSPFPTWTGHGTLEGVIQYGSSLTLQLSPNNAKDCTLSVTMTTSGGNGVALLRGSWATVNCTVQVRGEIAVSKPYRPDR